MFCCFEKLFYLNVKINKLGKFLIIFIKQEGISNLSFIDHKAQIISSKETEGNLRRNPFVDRE